VADTNVGMEAGAGEADAVVVDGGDAKFFWSKIEGDNK